MRLYVQVLLVVDLLAYASDLINPLLFDQLDPPAMVGPALWFRRGVTVCSLGIWAALKTFTLPHRAAVALEVAFTLGLAASYVVVALNYVEIPELSPVFALLGMILILVVRASLVPSTVVRTGAVGAASLGILLAGSASHLRTLDPSVTDGVTFMGVAIVIATCVSSRVIYGLHERVRDMTRLGQYVIESKLGEGGMGIVYRASHGMLRRPTAIKLLRPERAGEAELMRFEREVRLTAKLTHPNTVTVFDYGRTPDGVFYYAMELLDGATLEDIVAVTGAQPEARVREIMLACAGALHEAHAIGLIHRDIKPSNIMLCRRGGMHDVVKLLDFGLVKQLEGTPTSPELTATEAIVGTPLYMAPETALDPDSVDARTDLYSLGAVGYYLLTGTHVFDGRSVVEICAKHVGDEPIPLSERLAQPVSAELQQAIMGCLEKSPAARPASALALRDLLSRAPAADRFDASGWWTEHAKALAARHQAEPVSGRTIAVQPR